MDKLVKVRRIDGRDAWGVGAHRSAESGRAELRQAHVCAQFSRIFDRFSEQVVSLAVLGDEHPDWRPKSF